MAGLSFLCLEIHSECAELSRAGFLWRISIDIFSPGDLKIQETRFRDYRFQFCFQQSAGDSAGPEVDLQFSRIGHGFLDNYVRYLQSSFRFQRSVQLLEDTKLIHT